MKTSTLFNIYELQNYPNGKDYTCIVIDVLRASATIITALERGCGSVIPVLSMEEAKKSAKFWSSTDSGNNGKGEPQTQRSGRGLNRTDHPQNGNKGMQRKKIVLKSKAQNPKCHKPGN